MIFRMPKPILVRALKALRNQSISNINIVIYVLKLKFISTLPVYSMNALFQYIIEVIMSIRNSICSSDINELANHVRIFLNYIIEHYDKIAKIKQPFLYSYPKLISNYNFNNKKTIK